MSAIIHTGVAGTGKTLYVIQKYIIESLKKGIPVYTNIDGLDVSRIAIFYGLDILSVESLYRKIKDVKQFYKDVPANSLIVVDEVQNIFNNRDWQSKENNECIFYLMEHRHYGHTVIFVTPSVDSVDAGIRRVVQFTYKHKSLSMVGLTKQVKCAVFDQSNLSRSPMQIFSWKHDDRIYSCYKSYFTDNVKEEKIKVQPISPMLITMIIVSIVCIVFVIMHPPYLFNNPKKSKKVIINDNLRRDIENKGEKIRDSVYMTNRKEIKINGVEYYIGGER